MFDIRFEVKINMPVIEVNLGGRDKGREREINE